MMSEYVERPRIQQEVERVLFGGRRGHHTRSEPAVDNGATSIGEKATDVIRNLNERMTLELRFCLETEILEQIIRCELKTIIGKFSLGSFFFTLDCTRRRTTIFDQLELTAVM